MDTNFLIILDPEIDEETGEPILIASKINSNGDNDKGAEILGAFTGKEAEEVVDLFLGMKDKEDKNND